MLQRYPHELSGGQRQRVGFAQALSLRPKLILADEPVSMLDVSIRIGLLNVMAKLRDTEDVSILYITHDLASARYVADRLIVMYAGHIVETGPLEEVLDSPRHPYTELLLAAAPDPRAPLNVSSDADLGEPPRVIDPAPGCRFRTGAARAEAHRRVPPRHARAQGASPRSLGSVSRRPRGRPNGGLPPVRRQVTSARCAAPGLGQCGPVAARPGREPLPWT